MQANDKNKYEDVVNVLKRADLGYLKEESDVALVKTIIFLLSQDEEWVTIRQKDCIVKDVLKDFMRYDINGESVTLYPEECPDKLRVFLFEIKKRICRDQEELKINRIMNTFN